MYSRSVAGATVYDYSFLLATPPFSALTRPILGVKHTTRNWIKQFPKLEKPVCHYLLSWANRRIRLIQPSAKGGR